MVATSDCRQRLAVAGEPELVGDVGLVEVRGARVLHVGEGALELGRIGVRRVRAVGRVVEELAPVREVEAVGAVDQLRGPLTQPGVEVVVVEVGVDLAVHVELVVVLRVGVALHRRGPGLPAGRDVRAEARLLVVGEVAARVEGVLVEVLAEQRVAVAGGAEPDRQVVVLHGLLPPVVASLRPGVADHPVVVRVEPGEDRGARRTAAGLLDVEAGELGALVADQPVDVRHVGHQRRVEVVGEDHDDVGPLRGLLVAPEAGRLPGVTRGVGAVVVGRAAPSQAQAGARDDRSRGQHEDDEAEPRHPAEATAGPVASRNRARGRRAQPSSSATSRAHPQLSVTPAPPWP